MDVDIYAYGREIETDGDGEVGGFPADSGKFAQLFNRMRQHAVEFFFQNPWQRFEVTGFGAEKSDRMDKAFYLFRFQRFKSFRSSAAVSTSMRGLCLEMSRLHFSLWRIVSLKRWI